MSFVVLNERDKNTKEHFKYELTPESSATSSVEWGHPGHKLRITKKEKMFSSKKMCIFLHFFTVNDSKFYPIFILIFTYFFIFLTQFFHSYILRIVFLTKIALLIFTRFQLSFCIFFPPPYLI